MISNSTDQIEASSGKSHIGLWFSQPKGRFLAEVSPPVL
jgi:hypothetical protein